MRICFVSRGDLGAFKCREEKTGAELILFGFNGMGEVDYEKELRRESTFFEEATLLSKRDKNIVVCGCITNICGHKRKSAVVAENGKLLGVSDMQCAIDNEVSCGGGMKLYDTKQGKMGVLVADDLNFPEKIRSMVDCGCEFIVCPFGRIINELQTLLIRTYAYLFGITIYLCGRGYCAIADGRGKISFSSPFCPVVVNFAEEKEYHLIESRRRGVIRPSI